jgi:hypothetical protein
MFLLCVMWLALAGALLENKDDHIYTACFCEPPASIVTSLFHQSPIRSYTVILKYWHPSIPDLTLTSVIVWWYTAGIPNIST